MCKNSEIHISETKVTDCKFVQCLSCKPLKSGVLCVHQDLGKLYKSLKSGDLLSRSVVFPQGFPQNLGNLILRRRPTRENPRCVSTVRGSGRVRVHFDPFATRERYRRFENHRARLTAGSIVVRRRCAVTTLVANPSLRLATTFRTS